MGTLSLNTNDDVNNDSEDNLLGDLLKDNENIKVVKVRSEEVNQQSIFISTIWLKQNISF